MRTKFPATAGFVIGLWWLCRFDAVAADSPQTAPLRPRLAVLTDIGGDPDDQQSLIRLLAYANDFEIEALVASASGTRGELKQAVVRPDLIREIVGAYGKVLANLKRHADRWPSEEQLLACIKSGNPLRERAHIGDGHDTEGSRFLVERIDAGTSQRPLNVTIWGGQTDLAQALWRVKHDREPAKFDEFVKKFRVYDIADQDGIAAWMRAEFPGMNYILANAYPGHDKREGVFRGMYLTGDESLTSREWIERNVLSTGPLGALYPLKTHTLPNPHGCLKEGDTPSWFFFLPRGGNDPDDPAKPGWGGQFVRQADGWHRDVPAREGFDPRSTVSKWRGDFQRDFAQRMSWCRAETKPKLLSANSHYLQWKGRPILPVGDSVTQGWVEGGKNFDQEGYLNALSQRGINVVMLWSHYATGAQAQLADGRIGYDAPEILPWKGSPDDRSLDLTAFNEAYFARLREFVKLAESKDILVILTVQDGWPKRDKFEHHPFNAKLGNGPLTENRQLVELADYEREMPATYDPGWSRQQKNQFFQERFADKLCAELKDCSNLVFEMFNEGEWYDAEQRRRHEEHFLAYFRQRTSALLMSNVDHIRTASFTARDNPAVDILSFHKTPWTGHYAVFEKEFKTEPARVIMESEPVPSFGHYQAEFGDAVTVEQLRAAVWERTLGGAGWVAQNDLSFGWDPKCGLAKQAKLRDEAYDYIGHAARFFNRSGVEFAAMAPHGALASTGQCLARPGVEYVVYAPHGGELTMDLSATEGELEARWFNPRSGEFQSAGEIRGGDARRRFAPPFEGDAVLHLKAADRRLAQATPTAGSEAAAKTSTTVSIVDGKWRINGETTYRHAKAEGLLMNVRMVNATFEDANEKTRPLDFDAEANADKFIARIPAYVAQGVRAFTLCLQGGHCGYEGAVNSAFEPDGSLRESYLQRMKRVIEACDRHGAVVILGCYYQRQDQILKDDDAVRAGLVNAVKWIEAGGFTNVVLEVANEFAHGGYNRKILKSVQGEAELIALAKKTSPRLLIGTGGMGGGDLPDELAKASDFVLIHFNTTKLQDVPARIAALKKHGKPIVCNEDDKIGEAGAKSAELCVAAGASWGFMHSEVNQYFPKLSFNGVEDDPLVYATLKRLTTASSAYFPPPDAQGGWRKVVEAGEMGRIAGMDKDKLDEAFQFIQGSTKNGGLLVLRRGWLVHEDYFGLGHREATPNLASCGKSFTSIAMGMLLAERPDLFPLGLEQKVFTPTYLPPRAFPLSDPRKQEIKLGQLLAFTAGIRGNNPAYVNGKATTIEPAGPDGWPALVDEVALGLRNADPKDPSPPAAATLWCDPGEGYSYATASIHLASIVHRHVAGMELQDYLERRLAKPLGWGRWGFAYKNQPQINHTPGGGGIALRPTDMLRFGYLLLQTGRWHDRQIVPADYVRACSRKSIYNPHYPYSLQFDVNEDGDCPELPRDAYWKSGSGGHALYVVPSLDLVVWKLGGRDDQYSPANTGLELDPAAANARPRGDWKETTAAPAALRKTLQLVVASIDDRPATPR